MDDLTGQSIKGYELKEKIGAGSFGAVYRAYQSQVKREVAVKIVLPQYANHPDFIRRFEAEAQLVARLEHPYITPLYDYWREPNSAFLVMRLFRGGSLREVIQESPLSLEEVAHVLDQIASALAIAHQNGVVHRDLKPANILRDEQGNNYLADFGIAKDIGTSTDLAATVQGAVVGSPAYLSPEQVKAEPVTPQSDIYSLGIVLYEMLTGEKPFASAGLSALLIKQVSEPLPNIQNILPSVPESVNAVIQQATAKDPDARYPNVLKMASAYRKAIALPGSPLEAQRSTVFTGLASAISEEEATVTIGTDSDSLRFTLPEPENPYKGLRAFQEADAADFYGRDSLVKQLLDRMAEHSDYARFLAVVGPSGSGKSSVVKAGLIPSIRTGGLPRSQKWFIVEMVPGAHPFEELEAALLRIAINPPASLLSQLKEDEMGLFRAIKRVLPDDPDTELLLVIDQFEEVFTLVADEDTRLTFLKALIKAINEPRSRLRLIVTLRADFYDKPLFYAEFGNAMRKRTEVVLPLSPEELIDAISRPAERVGLSLERGLPQAIAEDVGEQPGALPLLQYALTELFERREGRSLTLHAYKDTGGVSGALARRAEELFGSMNEDERAAARQMFLRLVTLGEGTEDTRRRVLQNELYSLAVNDEALQRVLDLFGQYRLLTFDRDPSTRENTVEVAHEALIRQWERLKDWINDKREELRLQRRLIAAAHEWAVSNHDRSFLASGTRLAQLEEWANTTDLALTGDEAGYLKASIEEREKQERIERERQEREHQLEERSRRFLRALAIVSIIGAVIASMLAAFAFQQRAEAQDNEARAVEQQKIAEEQRQIADEQRVIAEERALEVQSLALTANARNALNEFNPNLALKLALEASTAYQPPLPEVQRVLASTAYVPGVRHRMDIGSAAFDVAFNSDGTIGASAHNDGTIVLWNLVTGEEIRRLEGHEKRVNDVAFSPDDEWLLSGSDDMTAILWDVESGESIRTFTGHMDIINSVDFSSDGSMILTASGTSSNQQEPADATIRLWNPETGDELMVIRGHTGAIFEAKFSWNDTFIVSASGSLDRTARVWDITKEDDPATEENEQQIFISERHGGWVRSVDFSPDGAVVVSSSWDQTSGGSLRLWDVATGTEIQRYFGHNNTISTVLFSPDGTQLISSSADRSVRFLEVATGLQLMRFQGHGDGVLSVALSSDARHLLVGEGNTGSSQLDTGVLLYDLNYGAEVHRLLDHNEWSWGVAFSPDGNYALSSSGAFSDDKGNNVILYWDIETGEILQTLEGHIDTVYNVAFNADGTQAVSGSWDRTAILWDLTTGEMIRQFGTPLSRSEATEEELSRRGADGKLAPYEGEGHGGRVFGAVFSLDERYIITGAGDSDIRIWDIETGEVVRRLTGHTGAVNAIDLSPDGKTILSASEDGTLRLWDFETGDLIREITGHSSGVMSAVFNADGTLILSGSKDSTMRLWNAADGTEIRQFIGHTGQVNAVDISFDGQFAISGASDRTLRLWEVGSGVEIRRFAEHTDWVNGVKFSPDGTLALSTSNDETVRLWLIARSVDELVDWAASNRYIPTLTCEQKAQYNLDDPACE
ncbi:MAG: protein kinase [Anaerolineae bacterium]|nr:protein kinase [Anaerolineae bacterium]